jgi:hypothetical protein
MGRTALAAFLVLACSALSAGCDDTSKACYDDVDRPLKQRVSACGELCDKEDGKACAKQDELANAECFEKGNAEICEWMCNFATTGKDLYCKKHEELQTEKR